MQKRLLSPVCGRSITGLRQRQLSAALALCFFGTVPAATITVNTSSAGSVAGACTLLDAVTSANTGAVAPSSNCAAGSVNGPNTIVFSPGITDIVFTSPVAGTVDALQVAGNLTIDGGAVPGSGIPKVTLERSSISDFRLIGGTAVSSVTLKGLTLRNGHTAGNYQYGGAVYAPSVAVYDSVLTGNGTSGRLASGGAIGANKAPITIVNSTISGNSTTGFRGTGGGIADYLGGRITNSTISDNTTAGQYANGGGLAAGNSSGLTFKNSTISGNSTSGSHSSGGGIAGDVVEVTYSTINGNHVLSQDKFEHGGGIFCETLTVTNSTISGNSAFAGGGGTDAIYKTILQLSTITANSVGVGGIGAGVELGDPSSSYGSIIFGNTGANDIDSQATSNTLSGYLNLIGTHGPGLIVPSDTKSCDPLLGPLGSNGGPTKTRGLLNGSCAINAGPANPILAGVLPPTPIKTDQRGAGYSRVVGGSSDIGAFEKQGPDDPDLIFSDGFELN